MVDMPGTDGAEQAGPDGAPASAGPRRFLTPDQVAEELNVSRSQTMALLRDGSLTAVQIGGRGQWRVERCQLEAFIARLYREAERRRPEDDPEP